MLFKKQYATISLVEISLNPYSNGICSLSLVAGDVRHTGGSLNPYSNGICSLRQHAGRGSTERGSS